MGIKISESWYDKEGKEIRYSFHCPGCGCSHGFSKAWSFNGDFEKPTVKPSILVTWEDFIDHNDHAKGTKKYRCHSFITDGKIRFLNDCTHALAGQTVELPDF